MNTLGKLFRVATWGESHGPAIGCVIDGCPSKIKITAKDIQKDLDKRKPGQSSVTTQRKESDTAHIMSGVFENKTTGTPISLVIYNEDHHSKSYDNIKNLYRPGHADYTYQQKYGIRDYRGGGRASGRETAARVAAGAVAKKVLAPSKIKIIAYTKQIGDVAARGITAPLESPEGDSNAMSNKRRSPLRETPAELVEKVDYQQIEKNIVRCPDAKAAKEMIKVIEKVRNQGDSIGGVVELVIKNVPVGLGEPTFDKLNAELAKAMMSIGAVKGIEFGIGFDVATKKGSENNDEMIGALTTPSPSLKRRGIAVASSSFQGGDGGVYNIDFKTNNAGGILGGISTGQDIVVRLAIKPTSSIAKKQKTIDVKGKNTNIKVIGRHDPCLCPRVVPVVEAMAALVLVDFWLINRAYK